MIWMLFVAALQAPSGWQYVVPGSWTPFAISDDDRTMILSQPRSTAAPRMWFRNEYKEGVNPEGVRSARGLMEADCEGGRVRFLESHIFMQPNLVGESERESPSQEWSYPAPQTFAEHQLRLICQSPAPTPGV